MKDQVRGGLFLSTTHVCSLLWGWVWNLEQFVCGVGGGTLLGPEGSAGWLVACGLLRPLFRVMRGGGGWWVCCLRSA